MGKSSGPSKETQAAEGRLADSEVQIGQASNQRAQQLFDIALPGLQTSENFYNTAATGDPSALQRITGPASQQISAATDAAKKNIQANTPRGGAQDLALEEADVQAAGQKGQVATNAYLGAFPALASLGGQNVGLSGNQTSNAIAGYNAASGTYNNLEQQQAAGKASGLGFAGGLAGSAAQVGASALLK